MIWHVSKKRLLLDYTGDSHSVAGSWYTGDFDAAWRDMEAGCKGLQKHLIEFKAESL